MPYTIHTESSNVQFLNANFDKDLGYKYPNDLDLRPGSKLHNKIVDTVKNRARESYDVMKRRHPDWNKIDEKLTAYIPLSDQEKLVKQQDVRKPVAVVIPYSYAMLETLLTYYVAAFLDLPMFKYNGVGSEDVIGAALLERIISIHCNRFKVGLNLHTAMRDSLVYGFGAVSPVWEEKWGVSRKPNNMGGIDKYDDILYEGNKLINIDPYCYLPDPSVPIQDVQRGEFVGYVERTNFMTLMTEEGMSNSDYFNVGYLKNVDGRSTILNVSNDSGRETKYGGASRDAMINLTSKPVDIIHMYVTIIPSDEEWKIGNKKYPEKWLFSVAADNLVIRAQPMNLDHDMYPITIGSPDYDGYSLMPVSSMEIIYGLQEVVDFLITSHITNIRKAVNDMFVVDPFLINTADLEDPKPGKLIRMRRAAWGRGVENAIKQLDVNDVTRGNIADAGYMMDTMQRSSGAVDSMMGIMRSGGERRSATEARGTMSSALSRLAKSAKIMSMMFMYDIGYMFAKHTQQLMSKDMFVRTVGRYQEELAKEYGADVNRIPVNIQDILVDTDIEISDGSIQSGEFADVWTNIFQTMATQPWLGGQFDMVRVFKHIARLAGAKNLDDFEKKTGGLQGQVMPDETVDQQVEAGNLVPIDQMMQGGMQG